MCADILGVCHGSMVGLKELLYREGLAINQVILLAAMSIDVPLVAIPKRM